MEIDHDVSCALDNLRVHQRQLDMDGIEVGVSRQALNEVIRAFGSVHSDLAGAKIALEQAWGSNRERAARIAALEAQLAEVRAERDRFEAKKVSLQDDVIPGLIARAEKAEAQLAGRAAIAKAEGRGDG